MAQIRKLAAIMFTDIVGYTKLMGEDEAKALSVLRANREIQTSLIKDYNGRFIKEIGDGTLSSFDSSTQAVSCAIAIQLAAISQNIPLRIGIHQGEIIEENDDVFGDGVNVASRLEKLGIAGSIILTGKVQQEIENKNLRTINLGKHEFRNVSRPVQVFALDQDGLGIPVAIEKDDPSALTGRKTKTSKISLIIMGALILVILGQILYSNYFSTGLSEDDVAKSIAVLPFDNITGDEDQEHLSDGLTEELIYRLSMVSGFKKVIPRASVMRYKGSGMEIPAISEELGVTNVLAGSFGRSGNMIRITASLINGRTGEIITPYRFDRPFGDIFAIQSEVANDIVDKLSIDLSTNERKALGTSATNNVEAYNLFLKAGKRRGQVGWDSIGYSFLLQSVELDSTFATAYASLASYWYNQGFRNSKNIDRSIIERNTETFLSKALSLNENDPNSILFSANYQLWYKWDFEKAEYYYKRYEKVNPGFENNTSIMTSLFYSAMGRTDEAVKNAEIALKNGSYSPISYSLMLTYYLDGQIDKSKQLLNEGISLFGIKPHNVVGAGTRLLSYLGEYEKVIELISEAFDGSFENIGPGYRALLAIAYNGIGEKELAQAQLNKLLSIGETTWIGSPSYFASMVLANMGRIEESFMQLQKAYKKRETEMYWLKVEPLFKPLHDDPRWQEIPRRSLNHTMHKQREHREEHSGRNAQ